MTSLKARTKQNNGRHSPTPSVKRVLQPTRSGQPVLISGGAGFIGANLAHRLLSAGQSVLLYDNLSRPGVEQNFQWLQKTHGDLVRLEIADVRDARALRLAVRRASSVFHFAAQVAVTTSLSDPIQDFEVNARGTLNVLEALRARTTPPPLLFTSTNKVYGDLKDVDLRANTTRYEPSDPDLREHGIGEPRPLDFHSPYGCSKGCACQYVLDYARSFRLPTVAFHMSCIYGLHQHGTEDQGWVAHFLLRALENSPITIYGDGRQVRDILFVDDLVNAFLLAHRHMRTLTGQAFNIGGGPGNTISLLELIALITELQGHGPKVQFAKWRSADQRYYVSDIRKFSIATGWSPQVNVREGVSRLYEWLRDSRRETGATVPDLTAAAVAGNGHQSHRASHLAAGAGRQIRLKSLSRARRMYQMNGVNGRHAAKKLVKALSR